MMIIIFTALFVIAVYVTESSVLMISGLIILPLMSFWCFREAFKEMKKLKDLEVKEKNNE